MTPTTSIAFAISILVLTGIGIGPFFSLPMVVVQNALEASRLGIGTAGLRYLGQLGATLGIAIVGSIVTSSVSGDLTNQLPTNATARLALSTALQHGFFAVLAFALLALIATLFLKERLIKATQGADKPTETEEEPEQELISV